MKRKDWFVLLFVITTLALLFIHSEFGGDYNSYDMRKDLPMIKASSAAYLLNPYFTITSENFADCAEDYFSAPAVLYFGCPGTTTRAIKDGEKASAFAAVFRDVSLIPISPKEYSDYCHNGELYNFFNAIGNLELCLWQGETCICLFSYDDGNSDGYVAFEDISECDINAGIFRVQGDLISECKSIAESLKDDSVEAPGFEPPH